MISALLNSRRCLKAKAIETKLNENLISLNHEPLKPNLSIIKYYIQYLTRATMYTIRG